VKANCEGFGDWVFKKRMALIGMDGSVGKKLELLVRTREEDYQELCK